MKCLSMIARKSIRRFVGRIYMERIVSNEMAVILLLEIKY